MKKNRALTKGQEQALVAISRHPAGLTTTEVAQRFDVVRQTTRNNLNRLLRLGFLSCKAFNRCDCRWFLSDEGKALAAKLKAAEVHRV